MGEGEGGDKGELEENGKMQEERREGERRRREERVWDAALEEYGMSVDVWCRA